MNYARYIAAALLVAATASPAAANWQFTKWGMTPEQVIKASSGRASLVSTGQTGGQTAGCQNVRAKMDYSSGALHFPASFLFDANGKLCQVELENADNTEALLRAKYGKPDMATSSGAVWYSDTDKIVLFLGTLDYMPRITSNNSGL